MAELVQDFVDDVRTTMFARAAAGRPFALATVARAMGGPRPAGAQMLVDGDTMHGFLSDGCIDADVALQARRVLEDGEARTLVYGQGSPFIDLRLPCGGRVEVLIERVDPDDAAVAALAGLTRARAVAVWQSDGNRRFCGAAGGDVAMTDPVVHRRFEPRQRLVVVGFGVFAAEIAALGVHVGWDVALVDPSGKQPVLPGVGAAGRSLEAHNATTPPDRWTAVAVATHESDLDHRALVVALSSAAGYVGVLGARRRLPERLTALTQAGIDDVALARLHAPIGLALGAETPREVAVAVVAEILADARSSSSSSTAAPAAERVER